MPSQQDNSDLREWLKAHFVPNYSPTTAWGNAIANHLTIPGLAALWPLGAVDDAGQAADVSSQGRILLYNGNPTYDYASLAPYVEFDGTGDYLSLADASCPNILGTETHIAASKRGLTIGGWFRLDTLPGVGISYGLIGKFGAVANRSYYLLATAVAAGGTIDFVVSDDGTTLYTVEGNVAVSDTWYHVVGRYDPSTEIAIFVNGVKFTDAVGIPAALYDGTSDLCIGARGDGTNYLDGYASLCWLSGMNLSDSIIKALYHHSRALYGVR